MEWCSTQVLDLLAARNGAEGIERTQLPASMFDRIEAAAGAATDCG
jgi:hypothetical protein